MKHRNTTRRQFLKIAGGSLSAAAVAGCLENSSDSEAVAGRPNILWITCEDINPWLGCYGDENAITPNIDKLAEEGILYENAYATAPVCAPSRSCLITGVYATSLGTQHLRSTIKLPSHIKPFPKYLRAAGYYCSNNYKEDYNFQDPNIWDDSSPTAHWRNRDKGQPFFSVFNFTSTHQGKINGHEEQFNENWRSKVPQELRHDAQQLSLPPYYPDTPMVRRIWARYYDLITYMDRQVAEVLAELEADGLARNTIVFFFADHGMGMPRYKRTLYDSGLHVPLIVRFPAPLKHLAPAKPGSRTDRLVSFVDFAPTVLSLLAIPPAGYMQGRPFMGPWKSDEPQYVFGASSRVDEAYEMARSVRDDRYKYIRNFLPHLPCIQPSEYCDRAEIMKELRSVADSGNLDDVQKTWWTPTRPREELYDTKSDPYETNNLIKSVFYRGTARKMSAALREWMLETRDTGLLPEGMMHDLTEAATPYQFAHSPQYDLERILDTADMVAAEDVRAAELIKRAEDDDPAVRYWAVLALGVLPEKDQAVETTLERALGDSQPVVRFTAAGALCRMGQCDQALPVLAEGLREDRLENVLHAAREIQLIGDKAKPIAEQIKQAQYRCLDSEGDYRNINHPMFIYWALYHALENCGLPPGPMPKI